MTAAEALDYINRPGPTEIIRNGRYWLPGPDGKPRYYSRATTIAKTLDDTHNLTQWAKRQVAVGIAGTPSLATAVLADSDNNKRVDGICEQAMTAAGGTEKRDLGTALHRLIERVDLNQTVNQGEWAGHISAYRQALTAHRLHVEPAWCETVLVNHTYGIAGRVDRLLRDPEGCLVVADLKTGSYRSWLSWAVQFAIYTTATHYWDEQSNLLMPVPEIRQDHSLAVWLPAAENPAHCQIIPLSTPIGIDGLLMALEVRRMRALDKEPHITASTYTHPGRQDALEQQIAASPPPATRDNLAERIAYLRAGHPEALKQLGARWPDGVPTLKQSDRHTVEQLGQIDVVLGRVEADHSIPF